MDVRRVVIRFFQAGPEFLFPLPQLAQALLDAFVVKTVLDRIENAFHAFLDLAQLGFPRSVTATTMHWQRRAGNAG
ncbi:hypothetical protein [Acetobacter okinawensis]|uniref:hypothetical protein n=1 Tax=Acetobacter okinawensis TaxID=1076594 RepID=UPI0039E77C53